MMTHPTLDPDTMFVLIDRETGEEKTHVRPTRVCRPMTRFTVGDVSVDEWVSLPEVTIEEGERQPWPVAARFNGKFRACDLDKRYTVEGEARLQKAACKHTEVIVGMCSDGCQKSKGAPLPHHHGDQTNGFLLNSCWFCGAALINKCAKCRVCV